MPLISVIVPVYKVEPYLKRCIDSILGQTLTDFELILVDDGSPDNCGAICDDYAVNDKRIHVIHRSNGGLSAARNTGLDWIFANSDSQWLSFIDSDDWVHPQYLALLYESVLKHKTNISQCLFLELETDKYGSFPLVGREMCSMTPDEEYLSYYNAHAWGKMYRKNCFENIRYPEGKIFEDVAIWHKLLFAESRIAVIKEELYYYFYRAGSIVNSNWTSSHLDQVEAWDNQMRFLESYDNEQVYSVAVGRFLWVLSNQLKGVESSKAINKVEKKKYSELLRKKIGLVLKKNHSWLRNTEHYRWYYEIAHPRLAWCYWKIMRLIGKNKGK